MSSIASVERQQREVEPASAAPQVPHAITYSRKWAAALFLVDLVLFVASALLAHVFAQRVWHTPTFTKQVTGAAIMVALWIAMFQLLGLYRRTYAFRMRDELYFTIAALCLGAMPQLLIFTIVPHISTSRFGALLTLALSIPIVGTGRAAMYGLRGLRVFKRPSRIAFIGTTQRTAQAVGSIEVPTGPPPCVIAVDDVNSTLRGEHGRPVRKIESLEWFSQALQSGCGTLAFTEIIDPQLLPHVLDVAARYRLRVAFAPPRIKWEAYSLSLEANGSQALIVASPLNACTPSARLTKRVMDVALAAVALVFFTPLMLLCALAVYAESGAPVLYRQERVGMDGKPFFILKFRSMFLDAEKATGAIWVRENDDRRTRVGAILRRLSFDELPQFFNVLRGEMSLVGPRPERPVFVEEFRRQFARYDERHLVPPGITGWSHVHMQRLVHQDDIGERLQYDLRYVEQWTVWLDAAILFKTAIEFLFHKSV